MSFKDNLLANKNISNSKEDYRRKMLFLDLDGTIIETKSGKDFPQDKDDWKFKKGILSKLREYFKENWYGVIVTNQAGIDEGYITPKDFSDKVKSVMENIEIFLSNQYFNDIIRNNFFKRVYIADSNNHYYRKPSNEAAKHAKLAYNLDLSKCLMIGDASGLERKGEEKLEFVFKQSNGPTTMRVKDDLPIVLLKSKESIGSNFIVEGITNEEIDEIISNYIRRIPVIKEVDKEIKIYNKIKDHSDSDKMFAINSGIPYMDIEDFLTSEIYNYENTSNR